MPDLLAKGEAQLARDYAAFVETARKIDPARTPAEVMTGLSDDHPTADDLIPSVRRSIDEARRYLIEKKIVTIPSEVRPRIEETPPYRPVGELRLDGHPRALRDGGDRGVLLRHAGREGLGRRSTPTSTSASTTPRSWR